jgi:hypothetical protein
MINGDTHIFKGNNSSFYSPLQFGYYTWSARRRSPNPRARSPQCPVKSAARRAYKQPQGLGRTPPHALSPAQARFRRTLPWARRATARQATRASATAASSLQPPPVCTSSSVSSARDPWSSPNPRTWQSLTGDPESPSPDFFRSPANVDRVSLCSILKFLSYTASTSPGRASRANQLDYPTVGRPKYSLSTSSPACARGPAYSDHPRRRSTHQLDHQDLPYTLGHFTGAIPPPVSPSALSSVAATVSLGEGPWDWFSRTLGSFLRSQRLMWIVTQGPVSKKT